jgi:hypothetical protein
LNTATKWKGLSISKDPKQSAIAEAGVSGCLDCVQKLLNFTFDKCRRFAFGPRKSLGLDFAGGIHGEHSFFDEPGKQHPDGGHMLFDRGRRGLALKDFDIRGNRDRFNVFEVLVPGALGPGQEFVNRYDSKPKRRLFEILKSQGMQMNQAVTFLSDGGDTVRDLQMYLNPQAEHLLDWFHISMRLTVMKSASQEHRG